jgi:uncharacterized protein YggE
MARALWILIALASQAGMATEPDPRLIAVTGVGEVRVAPDRATLQLGVESRQLDLAAARREVTQAVAEFLTFCEKMGIAEKDLATSGLTIQPEYSWNNNVRRLTGYFVARSLNVNLTDLDKLGGLIEGAVDQGVNQVSEPVFGLSDRGRFQRQAMAAAAEDARRNAVALAEALNVSVGPIISITAMGPGSAPPPRPMMMRMEAAADAGGGAQTYRSGEITFSVQVEARFAIEETD